MRLPKPSAPFSPVCVVGESITVDTAGKVLVLPSGNPDILPAHNEYVLSSRRLSLEDYPWGGVSDFPDFLPGTLYTATDGIYLTDIAGNNSTKTLTAGKLAELGNLTVDTDAHTITEEFVIANNGLSNNPTVIDTCDSATGWGIIDGTGEITIENGRIKVVGVSAANGRLYIQKNIALDLSAHTFISFSVESTIAGYARMVIRNNTNNVTWESNVKIAISANLNSKYVLPLKAPALATGMNPTTINGTVNFSNVTAINTGVLIAPDTPVTFYLDNITADTAKTAIIEAQVPDNLSATSLSLYTHNGTAYQLCSTHSLDGAYSQVSQTSANFTYPDSTKFDDVYGTGLGRAVFPKGSAGATVNGSSGSVTYSENRGTDKRIGLKFNLPPSDNGRTNFNKIRAKLVINYAPDAENVYSATHIFADSTNTSYGLQNLSKPWIALYDPTSNLIDFYLFTYRPKNLEFKRDESGTIYEVKLYPGNGLIYHGQITFSDLTRDSNSDLIPDFLDSSVLGSLSKFLQSYATVDGTPGVKQFLTADGKEFLTADGKYLFVRA